MFDSDIGHFNVAGGLELLAAAGVRYHSEYYEALLAGGLAHLVAESTAPPELAEEKSKPKAEANKSRTPVLENKG